MLLWFGCTMKRRFPSIWTRWESRISFPFNRNFTNGAIVVKLVTSVLLPMMVFVHADPKERMEVLSFSTVSRYMVMRGESSPAVIPDEQMARFRFMLDYSEESISMNSSPLARGEKVRVIKGPLTGLVGELVNVDGRSKIAVRLNMLGCACVDMPVGYVEPIMAAV